MRKRVVASFCFLAILVLIGSIAVSWCLQRTSRSRSCYVVVGTVKYAPYSWTPVKCYLTIESVVSEPTEPWGWRLGPGWVLSLSPTEGIQLDKYNGARGTVTIDRTAEGPIKVVKWVEMSPPSVS